MTSPSVFSLRRLCTLLCMCVCLPTTACEDPPKLLVISMDSLVYHFIENIPATAIPHFDYFRKNGVLLKQMMNQFPSVTYVNHYTLLTGLYPESHGIIHNHFYDPALNDHFDFGLAKCNVESKWYDVGAEPIYVTNSKAGGKRKSGTVLFPTSTARVKGVAPDRMVPDDGTYAPQWDNYEFPFLNMSYHARVDTIISWFTDPHDPINLGLLYFPEPDEFSHDYGPDSQQVRDVITGPLNDALGYLIDKLREHKLLDTTNVILTADHGQTTAKRVVILDEYLDPDAYTLGGMFKNGLVLEVYPKEGKEDEVIGNLTRSPHLLVYKKDSPEMRSLHHSRNPRIAPVVVTGSEGTVMLKTQEMADKYKNGPYGVHGYDPRAVAAMRPLFMATGPSFKKGLESNQFNSVDVYPLMCHLLGLTPAPNNGSFDNVRHLLVETSGVGRRSVDMRSFVAGICSIRRCDLAQHMTDSLLDSINATGDKLKAIT